MSVDSKLPEAIFNVVKYTAKIVLLVVLYTFLQHIFDMHFVCSCRFGLHPNGVLFPLLPGLILTFIISILQPFYQRGFPSRWQCWGFHSCSSCWSDYLIGFVVKFITLTTIWITLVLFDGDWYVCLKTNFNQNQTGIPCKTNRTYEEQRCQDAYRTESLDLGLYVSCPFLFLWSILDIQRARLKTCACRQLRCCCLPYYNVVFQNFLAEEVNNHLIQELKNLAKKRAERICGRPLLEIEQRQGRCDEALEVWEEISDSGFFLKEPE